MKASTFRSNNEYIFSQYISLRYIKCSQICLLGSNWWAPFWATVICFLRFRLYSIVGRRFNIDDKGLCLAVIFSPATEGSWTHTARSAATSTTSTTGTTGTTSTWFPGPLLLIPTWAALIELQGVEGHGAEALSTCTNRPEASPESVEFCVACQQLIWQNVPRSRDQTSTFFPYCFAEITREKPAGNNKVI